MNYRQWKKNEIGPMNDKWKGEKKIQKKGKKEGREESREI